MDGTWCVQKSLYRHFIPVVRYRINAEKTSYKLTIKWIEVLLL
jgi:hypothetical protein